MTDQRDGGIAWCDETWNPITGCSIVSPGCTNCYAMQQARRNESMGSARYAGTTKVVNGKAVWTGLLNQAPRETLTAPLRWSRPRRVFVNSMSDLFHDNVPDAWIDEVFAIMALSPQHTFQVLTKRPKRMREYLNGPYPGGKGPYPGGDGVFARVADRTFDFVPTTGHLPPNITQLPVGPIRADGTPEFGYRRFLNLGPLPNVWLGVSAEDQTRLDERIDDLLNVEAAVRFLSIEPQIGLVDLCEALDIWWNQTKGDFVREAGPRPDWVIVGGESGPQARPFDLDWARAVVRQTRAAGVACFVKQLGSNAWQRGHRVELKHKKGGDMAEWPEELRVQEWPT